MITIMNFQERKHDSADNLIIRARLNHNYCKLIDSTFLYLQKKLWQLLHLIYFGELNAFLNGLSLLSPYRHILILC